MVSCPSYGVSRHRIPLFREGLLTSTWSPATGTSTAAATLRTHFFLLFFFDGGVDRLLVFIQQGVDLCIHFLTHFLAGGSACLAVTTRTLAQLPALLSKPLGDFAEFRGLGFIEAKPGNRFGQALVCFGSPVGAISPVSRCGGRLSGGGRCGFCSTLGAVAATSTKESKATE